MSEENVELVRNWWAETSDWFNDPRRGDPEWLAEISARYAADDVVYEEDPVWPDADTYRGRDAILKRFLEYFEVLGMERIDVGEIFDAGDDLVFLEFRAHMGLGADSGESVSFLWGYTIKVEQGRVVRFRAWFDPEEGRRAAGLSE
jgi:hypothetical protein